MSIGSFWNIVTEVAEFAMYNPFARKETSLHFSNQVKRKLKLEATTKLLFLFYGCVHFILVIPNLVLCLCMLHQKNKA